MSLLDFSLSDVEELADELEISFLSDMGDGGLFPLGDSPLAVTDVEEVFQDGRNIDSRGASCSRYVEEVCGLLTPPHSPQECVTISDSEDSDTESYTSIPWSLAISDFSESPLLDIEKDIVAACADAADEDGEVPDCVVEELGDSLVDGTTSEENEHEHCFSPFLSRKPRGAGTKKLEVGKRRKARASREMTVPEDTKETCRYPLRNRIPGRSSTKAKDSNPASQTGEDPSSAKGRRTDGCRVFDVSVKTVKDLNLKPCRVLVKRLELGAEKVDRAAGDSGRNNAEVGVAPQVAVRKSKADKPSVTEGAANTSNGFQDHDHGISIGLKNCVVLLERLSARELAQLSRPKNSLVIDQSSTATAAIQQHPKVPKQRRKRKIHDTTELRRSSRQRVIRKPWQISEIPKRKFKSSKKMVNQPRKSQNRTNVQLNYPEISISRKESGLVQDMRVSTDEFDEDENAKKIEERVEATCQPRLILVGEQRSNLNLLIKSALRQKCPQLDWKSTALKITLPSVAIQQRRKIYFTLRAVIQECNEGI